MAKTLYTISKRFHGAWIVERQTMFSSVKDSTVKELELEGFDTMVEATPLSED